MSSFKRFLFGGIGALMPVLLAIASLDLGQNFSLGNITGIVIRYGVLFCIGGFVAYLHSDENKPIKLFEFGIAAPAMLTSLMAANALPGSQPKKPPANNDRVGFSFLVSSAQAAEFPSHRSLENTLVAKNFFSDLRDGITGKVYTNAQNGQPSELLKQQPTSGNIWILATEGTAPPGAFVAGKEADPKGEDIYICRAQFHSGVHPGKLRPTFGGCNIGWGGEEHTVSSYQVLVGDNFKWVSARNGNIANGAVHGGEEHPPGKEELFICRANYKNGIHPGKIRPAFRGCDIGWGGKEVTIGEYEVLVK